MAAALDQEGAIAATAEQLRSSGSTQLALAPYLIGPELGEGLLDLALACHLAGDVGGEVSACEQATRVDPRSEPAWSRYANALARTARTSEAAGAAERAIALGAGEETAELLARLREAARRVLAA